MLQLRVQLRIHFKKQLKMQTKVTKKDAFEFLIDGAHKWCTC